jgi:hypothetical protein
VELIANRDKSTFSAADGHGWRRCDEASSAEVGLPDAAERIFEKAEILANQGKHAEALDRFREGLKIQALHLQPTACNTTACALRHFNILHGNPQRTTCTVRHRSMHSAT